MRDEKAISHQVRTFYAERPLEKMDFMELMHLWRYGSLKHPHIVDEPRFWEIVKRRACEESK